MSWLLRCSRGVSLFLFVYYGFITDPVAIDNLLWLVILPTLGTLGVCLLQDLVFEDYDRLDVQTSKAPSFDIRLLFRFNSSYFCRIDDVYVILIP